MDQLETIDILIFISLALNLLFTLTALLLALTTNRPNYSFAADQFKLYTTKYALNLTVAILLLLQNILYLLSGLFSLLELQLNYVLQYLHAQAYTTAIFTLYVFISLLTAHLARCFQSNPLVVVSFRQYLFHGLSASLAFQVLIGLVGIVGRQYETVLQNRTLCQRFNYTDNSIDGGCIPGYITWRIVTLEVQQTLLIIINLYHLVLILYRKFHSRHAQAHPSASCLLVNTLVVYYLVFIFGLQFAFYPIYTAIRLTSGITYDTGDQEEVDEWISVGNFSQGLALLLEQLYLYWCRRRITSRCSTG